MIHQYNLLPGIDPVIYGTNIYHRLLEEDENIGKNGEELTIVVLSCERAQSTIQMMQSIEKHIPEFKGKFLIADNGSSKETKQLLKQACLDMPFECNMVEFEKNLGVAKGRNRAIESVTTNWFMSLDNDILFSMNILPEIQKTISQYGCHFVNLPLLDQTGEKIYSMGGNLFIEPIRNGIHIGCGGCFVPEKCEKNEKTQPSLSTFLFGGASVMKKDTFEACGKFDEGLFVGFEDIDFSITLFQKGYKIVTAGLLGLIHDHKKPETQSDLEYEKQRFSNKRLFESATYFENKHGFKIWNDATDEWLKERGESLGIKQEEKQVTSKKKETLCVVINKRGGKQEEEYEKQKQDLQTNYLVDILYLEDIKRNIISLIYGLQRAKNVFFLDSSILKEATREKIDNYTAIYGLDSNWFLKRYLDEIHLFTEEKQATFLNRKLIQCSFLASEIKRKEKNKGEKNAKS